jgi:hypothetical protein
MRKLVTLMIMLALFAMCFAPAVVAAPPGSDNGMAGTNGADPDGGEDPPIDPPDGDPWEPAGKMATPDEDNMDMDFWLVIKIWSIRIICVR